MTFIKPRLSFWQIWNMNFGFFGIQYSFGLQQTNMSPIYSYLGAEESSLPLLWLAGPITGLIIQPIIGAMSDKTYGRFGRRKPYFLVGALLCSLCLLFMPFSSALWMAAGLLWILDAGNNIAMEPYRAFISDNIPAPQLSLGFLMQSFFFGLGITLAYFTPTIFEWTGISGQMPSGIPYRTVAAFLVGAVASIATIGYSVMTTPEYPLSQEEIDKIKASKGGAWANLLEIIDAFKEMPQTMRQLAVMKLFQWFAMFCYWQYVTKTISQSIFGTKDPLSSEFRQADLITSQINGFYNIVTFSSAFILVWFAKKFGAKWVHFVCLILAGIAMLTIPQIHNREFLYAPMVGFGIAWASIMSMPYEMLAGSIPPERTGVYMGIFNMFIVIPMMIQIIFTWLTYDSLLGGNPANVLRMGGICMFFAAIAVTFVKIVKTEGDADKPVSFGGGH